MALVSPGVEVTIVDQSQYLPAPTNSVPLFIVATAQNKTDATSTGIAAATTKANAGKLYQVTSQRDLVTLYGNPFFYNDTNGTPINGYELNEYGLLAAYSALGVSNRAYVLRADINLSELVGRASRPTGNVSDGTFWLNSASTTWGIYEWNSATGKFVAKTPLVLTTPSQMSGGFPIASLGNIGDYAVWASPITSVPSLDPGKQYFYKTVDNAWVPLGGSAWRRSVPTVSATTSNPTLTPGGAFNLNMGGLFSTVITVNPAPSNTVADIATAINGLGWAGLSAGVRDGKLVLFHSDNATQTLELSQATNKGGSGSPLTELGVPGFAASLSDVATKTAVFYQPGFVYGSAAQMPLWSSDQATPRPNGSVWLKVGAAGVGYNPQLSKYSAALASWRSQTVNIGTSDWAMSSALDSTGGAAIPTNTVYAQYNYDNEYKEGPIYLFNRNSTGPTIVTGTKLNFTTPASVSQLRVQVSQPNSANLSAEYVVTVPANSTPTGFVTAWAGAGIPYTTATVTSSGAIQLTHVNGGEIVLSDYGWTGAGVAQTWSSNGLLASLGLVAGSTAGVKAGPSAAPKFYFTVNSTRSSGNWVVADDVSMLAIGDLVGFDREIGTINSSTLYRVASIDNSTTPPKQFTIEYFDAAAATWLPGIMVDAFGTVYGSKLDQTATTSASGVDARFLVENNYGDYKLLGDGIAYGGPGTAGTPSSTYSVGDLITISGDRLGGAATTNDLTLEVTANSMASFSGATGSSFNAAMYEEIATASATTATFAVFQGEVFGTDGLGVFTAPTLVVSSVSSGSIVAAVPGTYIQNQNGLSVPALPGGILAAGNDPVGVTAQDQPGAAIGITGITDNLTSFTVAAVAPWVVGMQVTILGSGVGFYNGTWIIASTDGLSFTVTIPTGGVGNAAAGGTAQGLGSGGVGFYAVDTAALSAGSQVVTQFRSILTVTATANDTTGGGGATIISSLPSAVAPSLIVAQLSGSGFKNYGSTTADGTYSPLAVTGGGATDTYYLNKPQSFGTCYLGIDRNNGVDLTTVKYMWVPNAPQYGTIRVGPGAGTAVPQLWDVNGAAPLVGNGNGTGVLLASGGAWPGAGLTFVEGTFGSAGVYGVVLDVAAQSVIVSTAYTQPSKQLTVAAMKSGRIEVGQNLVGQSTVPAPFGWNGAFPAMGNRALVTKNMFVCDISGNTMTIVNLVPGFQYGQLAVGQTVTGQGIPAGTKIVAMANGWDTSPTALTGTGEIVVGETYRLSTTVGTLTNVTATATGTGTGGVGTYTISDFLAPAVGAGDQWNDMNTPMFSNAGTAGAVTIVSGTAVDTQYKAQLSNWYPITFTASSSAPVANPVAGTNWYHFSVNEVDIMVKKGTEWVGYRNTGYNFTGSPASTPNTTDPAGVQVSASQPSKQSDGVSDLQWGDLWLDSSDLENYPRLYRWQSVNGVDSWVAINTTDQTSSAGIVFADARWGWNSSIDPVNDPLPSTIAGLTSNYVDLDAPNPALYPEGMLLWNTRRSGYVVKQFTTNRFTVGNYPDAPSYDSTEAGVAPTYGRGRLPLYSYTWVTVSGNQSNGAAYMGRKAQRAMVVKAMQAVVATNTAIRDEDNDFNLIAAPNYPELQPTMVTLNNDRGNTGFIVGDTPLRLKDDATQITAWATNAAGATSTGEDGLVTRDTYLGIFYPSGITTDLSGNQVVVPASHAMIRTFLRNDTIGFPWFAAAGTRRGVIDNLLNIGYIDAATGEFQAIKTRLGIRDVLYTNQINPLAFFTGVGLLSYGNKSSFNSQSALDRINVVRLVAYCRRALTLAARPFVFEPNDELTRQQILSVVQSLFADLVAKRGVYDYLVVCDSSNNTPARIDRNELWVDVAIEPVKAVEFIYIPVRILNTGELGNKA